LIDGPSDSDRRLRAFRRPCVDRDVLFLAKHRDAISLGLRPSEIDAIAVRQVIAGPYVTAGLIRAGQALYYIAEMAAGAFVVQSFEEGWPAEHEGFGVASSAPGGAVAHGVAPNGVAFVEIETATGRRQTAKVNSDGGYAVVLGAKVAGQTYRDGRGAIVRASGQLVFHN